MKTIFPSSQLALGLFVCSCSAQKVLELPQRYKDLDYLFEDANATAGSYSQGPVVDREFNGASTSPNWEFYYNIAGDVIPEGWPDEEWDRATYVQWGVKPDNNSELSGENGTFKAHDSWAICTTSLTLTPDPEEFPIDRDVQSRCEELLPEDCLSYLIDFAGTGEFCQTNRTERIWGASPCGMWSGNVSGTLAPSKSGKLDGLRPDQIGFFEINDYLPAVGDDGSNNTMALYDDSVQKIRMVWVGFGNASNLVEGEAWMEPSNDTTVGSIFQCMRPSVFSEGSRTLEDVAKGDGGEVLSARLALMSGFGCAAVLMNLVL